MSRNLPTVFLTPFIIIFLTLTIGLREVRGETNIIQTVNNGDSATHIDLAIIGSGFASEDLDEYKTRADENIDKMFTVNWFADNSDLFNVYRIDAVSQQSGVDLDDTAIYSLASEVPYDVLIVLHNYDCQESVQKPYIELCKYSNNYVVLAHELGHFIGKLDDEYYGSGTAYKCDGLSKRTLNTHDKPSNEKWSDLISTSPYEGARYCANNLWRPSENSIMKDSANTPYFDAVGYKAMDLGAGKILGTVESSNPSLQILGVHNNDTKSGTLNVEAITSDVSGIERVEFYWAKAGDTSKSIKIDKIYPYDVVVDTTQYENGKYYLDTVSYDKNWNYIRVMRLFNISNTGASDLYIPIVVHEALIKNDPGTDRINEPVTIGIPLAEDSGITSINELGLQNVSAGQFRILDRWQNGNIKWVLADFQTSLNAGETKEDIALINGAGNFGGNNLATEDDSYIYVNTNNAQFTIKKKNFNMFDKVVVGGVELVSQGNSGGLYIQGENDVTFSSINDPNSEVIVEENGPVRTVVKIMGSFTDSESNELMWYTVRMHFYKDKSYIKTFVTMKNANPIEIKRDVYSKNFNSMEVSVPINLNGDNSFVFSSNKGNLQGNFADGSDNAYLFQSFTSDHRTEWPRDDCHDLNCMFDFVGPGFVVNHNGSMLNELGNDSEWTNGWAEINDSTGKGMTMAMQWMSSYWPAGFDLYGDGKASIEFFSKYAQYGTSTPLIFGYAKHETRTLMFDFHTSATDNELVIKRLEAPLVARNSVAYYGDTKVIYSQEKITSVDEENQWRALHNLKPYSYDSDKGVNVWRLYWYSGVKGTDYEYKDIVNFLRTGYGRFFLNAEQKTNFNADYGITHTDSWTRNELTSFDRYWSSKNKGIFQIGGFDRLHNHWLGMPIYYWLTGDERIKEALYDYNEGYRNAQNYSKLGDMRGMGRQLRTIAYLYEFAGTPETGEALKQSMNSLLDSRDLEGSFYQGGRNLDRGYLWQAHNMKHNPDRQVADFYVTQIYSDACWCSYWILKNCDELNYIRIEELEDFQLGLAQFISKEMLFDDEHGLGYFYDYYIDEPMYYGSPNSFGREYYKRDSSRTMAFAYEQTGDESYLTIGERLLSYGLTYDTDMQRFHLMYDRLYKDNISTWQYLNNFDAQNNGGNNYTLTWTVPEGASELKIKYSDQPIVDWLGFDQMTREYEYSPDEYTAFFAATNIDNEPAPLAAGTEQNVVINIEEAINSYNTVRDLAPDNPSYVVYDPNKTYYFAMKYEHSPESGDQAISPPLPEDDVDTPPEDGGDTPPEDGRDTPPSEDDGGVEDDKIRGDLDVDGDIDRNDLNILLSHRDQTASACIACDLDGDGMITVLDARKLVVMCTRPRCSCE